MASISVIFNGEEILMTDLTSRTTCGDVIYALLIENGQVNGHEWAIFEKWKDVERRLPDRTKIAKVWKSWRSEKHNVRFVLQKAEFATSGRSRNRGSSGHRRYRDHKNSDAFSVQELTMQIMEQQKVLAEQVQRMNEIDQEIEARETDLHFRRVSEDGTDYVQQAYESDNKCPDLADLSINERDQYIKWCERILELGDKLLNEEQKIENLSLELSVLESNEDVPSLTTGRKKPKNRHVSFSLEENVRSVSPVGDEYPCFGNDGNYLEQNNPSHTLEDIAPPCAGKRLCDDTDPWGTYVVLRNSPRSVAVHSECYDDVCENKSNESGISSDQDLSPKEPIIERSLPARGTRQNVRSFGFEDDMKTQNRKACERWCQQIGARYPTLDYNDNVQYSKDARSKYNPSAVDLSAGRSIANLPISNGRMQLPLSPIGTNDIQDSYRNCPSSTELFEELNTERYKTMLKDELGFDKCARMSDNDSDTGLSSMHSSDMSVLETLV